MAEAASSAVTVDKDNVYYDCEVEIQQMDYFGNISWFIRAGLDQATIWEEDLGGLEQILIRTGHIKDEDSGTITDVIKMAYEAGKEGSSSVEELTEEIHAPMKRKDEALNEKIYMDEITILYQTDRYSELGYTAKKYLPSPKLCTHTYDAKEEYEKAKEEFMKKDGFVAYEEDTTTLRHACNNYFTAGEILKHIERFYFQEMTKEEKKAISETDDGWGYSDKAKVSLELGTVLLRHEVMGDCMNFEGIRCIGNKMYRLLLGS